MTHEVLVAGFGGQGILLLGHMLAEAALMEKRQVSWLSSYGQEMRGGTANCSVIISDERIGSPVVERPNLFMAMNLPSLLRFEAKVQPGGMMVVNSSLAGEQSQRTDIDIISAPMSEIAEGLNPKSLNLVALGVLVANSNVVSQESAIKAIKKMFGQKFAHQPELLEMNLDAFIAGYNYHPAMTGADCAACCACCQQSACAV